MSSAEGSLNSSFSQPLPELPQSSSSRAQRPGATVNASRILENARLQAAMANMLDDDDSMSVCDTPRKWTGDGDEQLNSAREYAARGQEFVASDQYKRMEMADKQTITGEWPSESIVNTVDRRPMRRVKYAENIALLANHLAEVSGNRSEALFNLIVRCSCRDQLDNLFACQLKRLGDEPFSPKFDQVMACLAFCAHCSFESLLPGGETVPEAAAYMDCHLLSCEQSSYVVCDNERLGECRASLERLFRALEFARWDLMNSEELTMVLFALLRLSLDRQLEHRRLMIVPVLNKIFTDLSEVDDKDEKFMDIVESLKRVFLHLSPSLITLAQASELLTLMDAAGRSETLVVGCVREVLSSQAETSDPGDWDTDVIALCGSFATLVEEESFRSNRNDLWAALMLLNDSLSPRVIAAASETDYGTVTRMFATVGRRLIKSHFIDDQIIDGLLRSIQQRFTTTWASAHPGEQLVGVSLDEREDDQSSHNSSVKSSPVKKRMRSDISSTDNSD
uniref:Wings apart-like protein C-terminal domain-containing protein n=1 Tax=Plectus sambesii TaxID=2011161 RepID=A0A914WH63_9BILA